MQVGQWQHLPSWVSEPEWSDKNFYESQCRVSEPGLYGQDVNVESELRGQQSRLNCLVQDIKAQAM